MKIIAYKIGDAYTLESTPGAVKVELELADGYYVHSSFLGERLIYSSGLYGMTVIQAIARGIATFVLFSTKHLK